MIKSALDAPTLDPTNQVIQGLWIGPRLSVLEQLSIRYFLAHGHDYHLYVYDDVEGVPPGTTLKDGKAIVDPSRIFTYQQGFGRHSYAGFSNLFRYELLLQRGGWWVDSDVVCLHTLDTPREQVFASSNEINYGLAANCCVMKTTAGSRLAQRLVEEFNRFDTNTLLFGQSGPLLLQRIIREEHLEADIAAPEEYCPVGWRDVGRIVYRRRSLALKQVLRDIKRRVRSLYRPDLRIGTITRATRTLHLWNEVWRSSGIDKNQMYAQSCLYEQLKRRYL
jgi:hypothetical protein